MSEATRKAWLESLVKADEDEVFVWVLAADEILNEAHEAEDTDRRVAAAGLLLVLLGRDSFLLQEMVFRAYGQSFN